MKNVLEVMNDLKEKGLIKDYAIGGAIATLRWTEPFFTRDLDIFVIPEKEVAENEILVLTDIYGYDKWVGQWIIIDGIPVQFIPAQGLEEDAVKNAVEVEYEGVKAKVITPEYLIASFLKTSREKDKIKIQMLLEQAEVDIGKLEEILNKYGLIKEFRDFYERWMKEKKK
jgi:predicted nucleotidyltransferase